jgi:hypothetical protein
MGENNYEKYNNQQQGPLFSSLFSFTVSWNNALLSLKNKREEK